MKQHRAPKGGPNIVTVIGSVENRKNPLRVCGGLLHPGRATCANNDRKVGRDMCEMLRQGRRILSWESAGQDRSPERFRLGCLDRLQGVASDAQGNG